jgi:hypothetical protein
VPTTYDSAPDDELFTDTGTRLLATVMAAEPALRALSEEFAQRPRAAGKWSPKQTLGHLVDSASNNHQRFVRAQEVDAYRGPGYAQEHWVSAQRYEQRPWSDLVALWVAYNRHLAHVIGVIPERHRDVVCTIGDGPTVTLSYVTRDYVGHVGHHLRQILAGH